MSYAFSASAGDKAALKRFVEAQLNETVRLQPDHKLDRAAVQTGVFSLIDAMETPVKGDEITADISGSVNYTKGEDDKKELRGASVRLHVYFSQRAPS